MRIRTIAAATGVGLLVALSGGVTGLGVQSASAHTQDVQCTPGNVVRVNLKDYPKGSTGTITFDDVVVRSGTFGGKDAPSLGFVRKVDPTVDHTIAISVVGSDGIGTRDFSVQTAALCGYTPLPKPTPPTPTPTPPVEVIEPRVQDYVKCTGAAFVLDNSASTVAVRYTVAGKPFDVPAGQVVHTDADGYLFPTDVGPYTITTTPGDQTWTFAPPTDCAVTTPPTTEPTPEPTTPPTDEPTTPVTPPTGEPTTPVPSDEPTTPAPVTPTPTAETTPPSASGEASATPTPTSTTPSSVAPTSNGSAAPVAGSTSGGARELAYTGAGSLLPVGLIALGLASVGGIVLAQRHAARSRANRASDPR